MSRRVGATNSVIREAELERYGPDMRDYVGWDADKALKRLLKDYDRAALFGVEATSDPRAMKGLVGAVGTYDGFIQTNQVDCEEGQLSEDDVDECFRLVRVATDGDYEPNALYCSVDAALIMKDWTEKVPFVKDISDPAVRISVPAGSAVGVYHSPITGQPIDLFIHAQIEHSDDTPDDNFLVVLTEELVARASFRPITPVTPPVLSDAKFLQFVTENSLECRVEVAHALAYSFTK
jgi:hypothetical protein